MTPRSDHGSTELQLAKEFWNFWPAFVRWTESQVPEGSLTPQRMRIIDLLYEHGPQKMSDLKDALGVTATNITALVDALEAAGLVERRPHPTDRRATLVAVAPRATSELCQGCSAFMERVSSLFSALSEPERAELLGLMGRLKLAMESRQSPA